MRGDGFDIHEFFGDQINCPWVNMTHAARHFDAQAFAANIGGGQGKTVTVGNTHQHDLAANSGNGAGILRTRWGIGRLEHDIHTAFLGWLEQTGGSAVNAVRTKF